MLGFTRSGLVCHHPQEDVRAGGVGRHCYVIAAMDVLLRNTSFKSKFEQMFSLSFRVTEDNLQQMGDTLEMAVISVLFRTIILYIQRFYARLDIIDFLIMRPSY